MHKKIIEMNFPEHIDHDYIAVDAVYIGGDLQQEYIWCECKTILTITKEMVNKNER